MHQILYEKKTRALVYRAFSIFTINNNRTDNNRITPVFDLSSSSESQELTTGLHEPAAAKWCTATQNDRICVSDDTKPGRRGAAMAAHRSPFSTSKFDVGQINTLRPATFEVVPVDSGRPVNIGAIVPQRVVGTFWISGAVSLLPGAPSVLLPVTSGRSFPCKNQDHSARVSRKYRGISKDAIIAIRSLIHSFIHSRSYPSSQSRVYYSHFVIPAKYLAKNRWIRIKTRI